MRRPTAMMSAVPHKTPPGQATAGGPSDPAAAAQTRNRWAAAYHEAGHAVFAYEVGWWVNYEGIDIDRQFTGLGCREIDYTPWRRAWVHLAGPLAEYRFLGTSPHPDIDRLAILLAKIRQGGHPPGDDREVLSALSDQFPDAADNVVLDEYRVYASEVWHELTCDQRLWRRIEAVAAELFRKSRLSADDVELLI